MPSWRTAGVSGPTFCWQVSNASRFTGGPGTGKSWAARALARLYKDLGLLTCPREVVRLEVPEAGSVPRSRDGGSALLRSASVAAGGSPRPGARRTGTVGALAAWAAVCVTVI